MAPEPPFLLLEICVIRMSFSFIHNDNANVRRNVVLKSSKS